MKAIFLDRDGVINKYPGDKKYVTSVRQFRFLPRAKVAIAKLHRKGFALFVISNQAGVGKGIYSRKNLNAITRLMLVGIAKKQGKIDGVYYCTHRPEANCACRKPRAGLIHKIKESYPVNLKKSFFIGDTIRDIHTARAAGCTSILVLCGREKISNQKSWEIQPDFVFKDLYQAAQFILKQK